MLLSKVILNISKAYNLQSTNRIINHNTRNIFHWLNIVFNQVDRSRIKQVGPDRACAEWLLRNGAAVQWKGCDKLQKDYNCLQTEYDCCKLHIEKVDASGSSISHYGFLHFRDCIYIKEIILHDCGYIEDEALRELKFVSNTLEHLQVSQCGNITDDGLLSLQQLKNLKLLEMSCLQQVKEKDAVLKTLKTELSNCKIITDFETEKQCQA